MQLVDTHCHIQEPDYPLSVEEVEERAAAADVTSMICVGTDATTSEQAVDFVQNKQNKWASIGLHPHDAKLGDDAFKTIKSLAGKPKVVAVGECGLDYFYGHSSKEDQARALRSQIELAQKHGLPLIFHVRDAFDDFWQIFDKYKNLRGVVHSFTDSQVNLNKAIERGLYVGVNGIATFTKVEAQREMYKAIPLTHLLLETDAPFLTPHPFRGSVNEPAHVRTVAEFLAELRNEPLDAIAAQTTKNAQTLFKLQND
ncbi:MAG: TatD family hydrolase [Candidatus Saccharimonadales bacterium]